MRAAQEAYERLMQAQRVITPEVAASYQAERQRQETNSRIRRKLPKVI